MDRIAVMDDVERERRLRESVLDDQLRALRKFALSPKHPERYEFVRAEVQTIMQPKGSEKLHDFAEERRCEVEIFFKGLGFTKIVVPPLELSNNQLNDLRKAGQEPEYRPSDAEVSYNAFMKAVSQGNHWTVTRNDRHKIDWEPCTVGYWFIADVHPSCPRTGTSWNDLTKKFHLLSLEEYVIVWWERKLRGIILDIPSWCWLRTRWNVSGALRADEYDGGVGVGRGGAEDLSLSNGNEGGRAQDMVNRT